MLVEESGISAEAIVARGYYTAARRADVPDAFPEWQRRLGLVIPTYSPSGATSYQLRPYKPSKPKRKYENIAGAGCILDVHPHNLERVRDASVDLLIVEGVKKGDSATSRGECVIALAGVFNWQRGGEPLPCWDYVPLEGRRVFIAFDSDVRSNWLVALAFKRIVAFLEGRGAKVLVIYLPDAPDGSKQGLDDRIAAGDSLAQLKLMARPYDPQDLAAVRLERDRPLRERIGELWRSWRAMPARKMAECTKRAVMRDLIAAAAERGKLQDGGVLVIRSQRDIAVGAQLSLGGTKKTLDRLEQEGLIRREMWGRAKDKPGAYVLLAPRGGGSAVREHNGKKESSEKTPRQETESFSTPSGGGFDRGVHVARTPAGAPSGEVPELRWPKVVHTWGWREGKRVVVDSLYVRRLGKRRGEIIRYLLEGGAALVSELVEAFGAKRARPRDFRRRILGPLETEGIIRIVGETTELTPSWREALEDARERAEEIEDARLQAEKFEREKKAFRQAAASPADPTPETKGRAHVRRTLEQHRARWARKEAEERRKMVRLAAEFARDIMNRNEYVRLGLLEEMWGERGGLKRHLRMALRELGCKAKRHAEHPGEWFVYPPEETGEDAPVQETPAVVVPLPNGVPVVVPEASGPRKPYKRADGVYVHPPECACEWCADEVEPSYAKIGGLA